MATRKAIEARKEALEGELARRAALSTSERQARYLTGRDVLVIVAEDVRDERDDEDRDEREAAWGDAERRERPELDGDATSRRQAARLTRGASSRGGV